MITIGTQVLGVPNPDKGVAYTVWLLRLESRGLHGDARDSMMQKLCDWASWPQGVLHIVVKDEEALLDKLLTYNPGTLLHLDQTVLQNIASFFVATEFNRPLAQKDLLSFSLTCKAIHTALFGSESVRLDLGLEQRSYIEHTLARSLPTSLIRDTHNNLVWRVCFETDLCILVLYRQGICRDAVLRVASFAAGYLQAHAKLGGDNEVAVNSVGARALSPSRFFGTPEKKPRDLGLDAALRFLEKDGRIENIMILLHMVHDVVMQKVDHDGLEEEFQLKKVPPFKEFFTKTFLLERAQVKKDESVPMTVSSRLGLLSDGPEYLDVGKHSSAMGRVVRVKDSRSSGFGKLQDDQDLPLVGGPSGSAVSLIRVALAAGIGDSLEHVRQFLLAIVVYLVGGGQHSVAEVMHGLSGILGEALGYQPGRYVSILPESLTSTPEWKRMLLKYKGYVDQI